MRNTVCIAVNRHRIAYTHCFNIARNNRMRFSSNENNKKEKRAQENNKAEDKPEGSSEKAQHRLQPFLLDVPAYRIGNAVCKRELLAVAKIPARLFGRAYPVFLDHIQSLFVVQHWRFRGKAPKETRHTGDCSY